MSSVWLFVDARLLSALGGALSLAQFPYPRPFGPMSTAEADRVIGSLQNRPNDARSLDYAFPELRQVLTSDRAALIVLIGSTNRKLAFEAVREAGGRKDPAFVDAVAKRLDRDCGLQAVSSLTEIGDAKARRAIKRAVGSPIPLVALVAAESAAEFGDSLGRKVMISALNNWTAVSRTIEPFRFDEHNGLRLGNALISIGYGKKEGELRNLIRGLDTASRLLLPRLAQTGWPDVPPYLRKMVVDQKLYHGMRKWSAIALGQIRCRAAIPELRRAAKDPVPAVSEAATEALSLMGQHP